MSLYLTSSISTSLVHIYLSNIVWAQSLESLEKGKEAKWLCLQKAVQS